MSLRPSSVPRSRSPSKKAFNALKGRPVKKSHFSSGIIDKDLKEDMAAHNRLVVKLFDGARLLASDAETGKSDPICFMWTGPADLGMPDWDDESNTSILTSAVCPTTVDPMWRSEHSFTLGEISLTDKLLIYVRDEDINLDGATSYDSLGLIDLSYKEILSQGKKMNNSGVVLGPMWKDLVKYPGMRRVDGKVKLTVTLHFGNSEESIQAVQAGLLEGNLTPGASIGDIIDAVQHQANPKAHPVRPSSPLAARPLSASRSSSRRPSSASPARSRSNSISSQAPMEEENEPMDSAAADDPGPSLPAVAEGDGDGDVEETDLIEDIPPPYAGDEAFPSFGDMKNTVTSFFGGTPAVAAVETASKESEAKRGGSAAAAAVAEPTPTKTGPPDVEPKKEETSSPSNQTPPIDKNSLNPPSAIPPVIANAATDNPAPAPVSSPASEKASAALTVPSKSSAPGVAPSALQPPVLDAPSGSSYKLKISNIHVKSLKDTGNLFDKQDPAVRFDVCGVKKETARMKDAGITASFPESFEFDIPSLMLLSSQITVDVVNKKENNSDKSLVGTGSKELSAIPPGDIGADVVIELSVADKKQGEVSFKCILVNLFDVSAQVEQSAVVASAPLPAASSSTSVNATGNVTITNATPAAVVAESSAVALAPNSSSSASAKGRDNVTNDKAQPAAAVSKAAVSKAAVSKAIPPVVGEKVSAKSSVKEPDETPTLKQNKEDSTITALRRQLEKANSETMYAQKELERLTKEMELKALQAQLKQREEQKQSFTKQLDGLRRTLTQMDEGQGMELSSEVAQDIDVAEESTASAADTADPGKKTSSKAKSKTTATSATKANKAITDKKRKEDAKARISEARKQVTEKGLEPETIIMVKPKNGNRNAFVDRDTDEEGTDEEKEIVKQNTLRNSQIPAVSKNTRTVTYPDNEYDRDDGEDEIIIMDEMSKRPERTDGSSEKYNPKGAMTYPLRAKGGMKAKHSSEPPAPLPPDRYPLRPSSSVLKEIQQLKLSTEEAVGALFQKLSALEITLNSEIESGQARPESYDYPIDNKQASTDFSNASQFSRTAPGAMSTHAAQQWQNSDPSYAPISPPEPRSDKLNWSHISTCIQTGQLHVAVSDVLTHGYSDDVLNLMKSLGPTPQRLSVSHRNSIFETISRVLASSSGNTYMPGSPSRLPNSTGGQPNVQNGKIDLCMAWVFALVNEGLTSTLTRTCHARLLDSLNKVSQEQANNTGVMASRYEHELRSNCW